MHNNIYESKKDPKRPIIIKTKGVNIFVVGCMGQ